MVNPKTEKTVFATIKAEVSVAKEFQSLNIVTDDWIPLTSVTQKLKYLINLYKNITRS